MKNNKKTIFLTGATGLVGSYLLNILLQKGDKVYVLARSKDNKNSRDRVMDILKFWDRKILSKKSRNLAVLDGDITKNNLGLDRQSLDLLASEIDEIFHSAAVTQFNWPLEKIRQVNVEGTKNVLDLAVKCKEKGRLKKVNHISTAYVCGDYKGIFRENDLDVGQVFSTTYEQSKFEAEKLVEEYREKGLWVDVFRLSALVGESETGKIFQFHHLYQLLYLWSLGILEVFPINGSFSINFTPVDNVAHALYCLSYNTKKKNKNYHLFGARSTTENEIFQLARKLIRFKKPRMILWEKFTEIKNLSFVQKDLINKAMLISSNFSRNLDSTKTIRILNEYNFKFPDFTKKQLINIIQYTIDSEFIKKNG